MKEDNKHQRSELQRLRAEEVNLEEQILTVYFKIEAVRPIEENMDYKL